MKTTCLTVLCLLALVVSGTAISAAKDNAPVMVRASQAAIKQDGEIRMLVMTKSTTDEMVQNVKIFVRPCGPAKDIKFHIKLGSAVDSSQGWVSYAPGKRALVWQVNAPASSADWPARLPVGFVLDDHQQTTRFCVHIWGQTPGSTSRIGDADYSWGNA